MRRIAYYVDVVAALPLFETALPLFENGSAAVRKALPLFETALPLFENGSGGVRKALPLFETALPSDVRRGSASPEGGRKQRGYAPGSGSAPA